MIALQDIVTFVKSVALGFWITSMVLWAITFFISRDTTNIAIMALTGWNVYLMTSIAELRHAQA